VASRLDKPAALAATGGVPASAIHQQAKGGARRSLGSAVIQAKMGDNSGCQVAPRSVRLTRITPISRGDDVANDVVMRQPKRFVYILKNCFRARTVFTVRRNEGVRIVTPRSFLDVIADYRSR